MRTVATESGPPSTVAYWSLFRWALGLAQILGATFAFLLLARLGVSELALAAALGTTVLTALSRLLFRH